MPGSVDRSGMWKVGAREACTDCSKVTYSSNNMTSGHKTVPDKLQMEAPTTISDLPFECVQRIFNLVDKKYLRAASLVCHDFHHLVNDGVQELELSYETIPHLNSYSKLLQRFRNVKCLTLHCPPDYNYFVGILDQIAESGLDLEFLSLPTCQWDRIGPFPRQSLIKISSNMPNLRSISPRYLTRDDDDLIALSEIFPDLEYLDLSCCGNVSEQGIEKALTRFRKLQGIDLSFNEDQVSKAWLFSLANCPLLEEINCVFSGEYDLTDINVCALLCGCPKLRWVVLGCINLDMINFPLVRATICEAKNLRFLEINGVTMVARDGEVSEAQIKKAFRSA